MKFKKILAGAMVGTMVLASVTGVSASTTYDDVTIEDGFSANTGSVTLTGDFDVTYTFTNTGDLEASSENWNNYILEMVGNGVYVDVRSDNFGWLYGQGDNDTLTFGDGLDDWTDWLTAMTAGTEVTVNVVRNSEDVVITCTAADATFTATAYVEEYTDDCEITMYLTGEQCTISDVSLTGTAAITLSDSSIGLLTGNTKTVSITPSFVEATVASADESIATATVADDVVTITAVAAGTTTVTVTSGTSSQEVAVTVSDEAIALTAITASADNTELTVGDTATISVAATPSDTTEDIVASYASSNEDVLTVSESGVVTAVAAGDATVTVSVINEAGETLTSTIDFTVAEVESESEEESESTDSDDADSTDSSDDTSSDDTDSTEESSEAVYTLVDEYDLDDTTIETWWEVESFTDSIALEEDHQYVITGTTTNNSTSNWNNVLYVLFSGDDGNVYAGGSDEAIAANYVEYFVGRADNYGWDSTGNTLEGTLADGTTYTSVSAPADDDAWAEWLAATQAGAEFTLTATYVDGKIQIEFVCGEVDYIITYTVADTSLTYYIALGGEATTLSDLHVADYEVSGVVLDDTTSEGNSSTDDGSTTSDGSSTTTTTTTTTTTATSTGGANTGDASPIIPIAVALLGCGAVVVASKKRMA